MDSVTCAGYDYARQTVIWASVSFPSAQYGYGIVEIFTIFLPNVQLLHTSPAERANPVFNSRSTPPPGTGKTKIHPDLRKIPSPIREI